MMVRKSSPSSAARGALELIQSARGEVFPFRQFFDVLRGAIDHGAGYVVSSLPRGGLQLVQPPRLPEPLLRGYTRDLDAHDRLAWGAITRGQTVDAEDCWDASALEASHFYNELLLPLGYRHALAAPLRAPVLEGYAGAIVLLRTTAQGQFPGEDRALLGEIAGELDSALHRTREQRPSAPCTETVPHRSDSHQFVFDSAAQPIYGETALDRLDETLSQNMVQAVRRRLAHVNGKVDGSDRVSLPDSRGDLWNFRLVIRGTYPALAEGPVVFVCVQPDCYDWGQLRQGDFQAAAELSRLIPALKFMHENFSKGPTLHEISQAVHLSPFHFHRRFTELLGITPKHFLLDCQIELAKQLLIEGRKDLSHVAAACGFAHQSHFTSRFKQATGLTPTRWRRMAANVQPAEAR